jgi:hypothetical protein
VKKFSYFSVLNLILNTQIEEKVKEAAEISMGTEISEEDILNIKHLCLQIVDIQVRPFPPPPPPPPPKKKTLDNDDNSSSARLVHSVVPTCLVSAAIMS